MGYWHRWIKLMDQHRPAFLVIDPLSALIKMKLPFAEMVCERILDQAKSAGITVLCTSLLENVSGADELSVSHVSTVADTWIHALLQNVNFVPRRTTVIELNPVEILTVKCGPTLQTGVRCHTSKGFSE